MFTPSRVKEEETAISANRRERERERIGMKKIGMKQNVKQDTLCADTRGIWLTREMAGLISWCCAGGKVTDQPYMTMRMRTA